MPQIPELIEVVDVGNRLGEGVLWRASDETVWWTDILSKLLYRLNWADHTVTVFETPYRLTAFSFLEGTDDILLAAFDEGIAYFEPVTGRHEWLDRPGELGRGVRLNDGRTDPQGRFWVGSMAERDLQEDELPPGRLYCVGTDEKLMPVRDGIHISNGLGWAPDGTAIYIADSPTGTISRADFEPETGRPGLFSPFVRIEDASPDGACVDAQGCYWSALWGGSCVNRYSAAGKLDLSLTLSCPQPTCACFGGPDLDHLIVTSARDGLEDEVLSRHALSGGLFIFKTGYRGLPGPRFKGRSWREHWTA